MLSFRRKLLTGSVLRALLGPVLLAASAAAPAEPASTAAGLYEIRQMEMAGGLELRPDGRFRYALEYGAASEQGEGKWRMLGDTVVLTSDPMPKAPTFELVKDEAAPAGELWVELAPPGFGNFTTDLRMLVTMKDGQIEPVEADSDGHVPIDSAKVAAIQLVVPIYGDVSTPIPVSGNGGHRLTVRFVPNDLGKARFQEEQLSREGDQLILYRYDAKIAFKPVRQ
jgi:hypothetical protein